jgi:hypothetical protein
MAHTAGRDPDHDLALTRYRIRQFNHFKGLGILFKVAYLLQNHGFHLAHLTRLIVFLAHMVANGDFIYTTLSRRFEKNDKG